MTTVEPIRDKKKIVEISRLLAKQNIRNYVLFKLGINCGLRISDILALNVEDVKNKNYIQIVEKKTKKKKIIPINAALKNLLKQYTKNRKNDEPLFKSFITKGRLDRYNAYRIIKKACQETNIEDNIGTHTLRKTFGYHYYKTFNDVVMLQKIFNHSSPAITLRYIGITQDEINNSYLNFSL